MPPAGILAIAALAGISYLYVGKPVYHGLKHVKNGIVHVVTLGKK
jgi:hypothetical protein